MRWSISMAIFKTIDIKQWFLSDVRKMNIILSISMQTVKKTQRKRWKRHYKQLLLLMRCKIIKLPVLNIWAKHAKIAINKEQRFPAALNFNEFDVQTTNICLRSFEVFKTYWKKYIFHTELFLHLDTGWNNNNYSRDQKGIWVA